MMKWEAVICLSEECKVVFSRVYTLGIPGYYPGITNVAGFRTRVPESQQQYCTALYSTLLSTP